MTPEVKAAVKHVKALASKKDGGYSSPRSRGYADAVMDVYAYLPEKQLYADLTTILSALTEARISLEDMSENYGNAEGELKLAEDRAEAAESALAEANERASLLQTAVHERCAERDEARKEIRRLSSALVDASVRVGTPGEIINSAQRGQALADVRTICETALNPQQEGSRDHG